MAATPWTLQSFERLSGRMSNRGQICLSMSSYGECDGPDRVLPALIQLPATKSAYKTRCSVLDVMEASTRLINPLPLDVVLVACHALQMLAAAVAQILRSVDVGAQAPTLFPVKMASRPSCAVRCAKIQKIRAGLLLLLSFSQQTPAFLQATIHRPRKKTSRPPLSTTP